jgi:hypothetical protein
MIAPRKSLAVIITDKNSRYFGRVGKFEDFTRDGVTVRFSPKEKYEFFQSNGKKPLRVFYRHADKIGTELDEAPIRAVQYLAKNEITVADGTRDATLTFSKPLEKDLYRKLTHDLICEYTNIAAMNRAINESRKSLDFISCGPSGLAQIYREYGGQISQFVDDYTEVFGERPEKLM